MSQSFDATLKCDSSNESYTERHFPVMLFCMQFKVVLLLSLWMKHLTVTIPMKATVKYTFL